jgi:predicted acetyltransferase
MTIRITEVTTWSDYKKFAKFPFKLYKDHPNWVPNLIRDEIKHIHPKYNPAYDFCEAKHWLAYDTNNKVVGRISAIINHQHNKKAEQFIGRIGKLEFIENFTVLKFLLNPAENWLRSRGMTEVHGPLGFMDGDQQGLLIKGFSYLPSIISIYHMPYYQNMIEKMGYEKVFDWLEYKLILTKKSITRLAKGAELVEKRTGVKIISFKSHKEIRQYIPIFFELLNKTYKHLPYTCQFNQKLINFYVKKMFDAINPNFFKVAKLNNEIVGFILCMPNLSQAMKKANGRLLPFGMWHILKSYRNIKNSTLDFLLIGVLDKYHKTGIAVKLIDEIHIEMQKAGMQTLECTGTVEYNYEAMSYWKNYEHEQHRTRRCYKKSLIQDYQATIA